MCGSQISEVLTIALGKLFICVAILGSPLQFNDFIHYVLLELVHALPGHFDVGYLAIEEKRLDERDLYCQILVHEVHDLLAVAFVGAGLRFPVVIVQVGRQYLVVDEVGSAVTLPSQPLDPGLEVTPVVLDRSCTVATSLFLEHYTNP